MKLQILYAVMAVSVSLSSGLDDQTSTTTVSSTSIAIKYEPPTQKSGRTRNSHGPRPTRPGSLGGSGQWPSADGPPWWKHGIKYDDDDIADHGLLGATRDSSQTGPYPDYMPTASRTFSVNPPEIYDHKEGRGGGGGGGGSSDIDFDDAAHSARPPRAFGVLTSILRFVLAESGNEKNERRSKLDRDPIAATGTSDRNDNAGVGVLHYGISLMARFVPPNFDRAAYLATYKERTSAASSIRPPRLFGLFISIFRAELMSSAISAHPLAADAKLATGRKETSVDPSDDVLESVGRLGMFQAAVLSDEHHHSNGKRSAMEYGAVLYSAAPRSMNNPFTYIIWTIGHPVGLLVRANGRQLRRDHIKTRGDVSVGSEQQKSGTSPTLESDSEKVQISEKGPGIAFPAWAYNMSQLATSGASRNVVPFTRGFSHFSLPSKVMSWSQILSGRDQIPPGQNKALPHKVSPVANDAKNSQEGLGLGSALFGAWVRMKIPFAR